MKTCLRCKTSKDESNFGKDNKKNDGLFCWCRECSRAYCREYKKQNLDAVHARNREYMAQYRKDKPDVMVKYRAENKSKIRETTRKYIKNHPDKARIWMDRAAERLRANPEARRKKAEYRHEWYTRNLQHVLAKQAKYVEQHPNEIRERARVYIK